MSSQVHDFPVLGFLIAIVVMLLLNKFYIVRYTINFLINKGRISSLISGQLSQQDEITLKESGRMIGTLEKAIYLYLLFAQMFMIIGAMLAFKGFTHWIVLISPKDLKLNISSDVIDKKEIESIIDEKLENILKIYQMNALNRYYAYAIGNFVSLSYALLIFQVIVTLGLDRMVSNSELLAWLNATGSHALAFMRNEMTLDQCRTNCP